MFRKIAYPAKYSELEKNRQKTLVAIKKRKNSLTVTIDTKKAFLLQCRQHGVISL